MLILVVKFILPTITKSSAFQVLSCGTFKVNFFAWKIGHTLRISVPQRHDFLSASSSRCTTLTTPLFGYFWQKNPVSFKFFSPLAYFNHKYVGNFSQKFLFEFSDIDYIPCLHLLQNPQTLLQALCLPLLIDPLHPLPLLIDLQGRCDQDALLGVRVDCGHFAVENSLNNILRLFTTTLAFICFKNLHNLILRSLKSLCHYFLQIL